MTDRPTNVIHLRTAADTAEAATNEAEKTRPRSVATYWVGGREYPLTYEPGCKVCNPFREYRYEIEDAIGRGYSAPTVLASLPEHVQAEVSTQNVNDHVRKHAQGLRDAVARTILEDRAIEMGKSLDNAAGTLVDHVGFARVGLQRAYEAMMSGDNEPTIENGIAFANFLLKVEELGGGAGDLDREIMFQAFLVYTKAIKAHTTPDQFREISGAIVSDPVMQALQVKALQAQSMDA